MSHRLPQNDDPDPTGSSERELEPPLSTDVCDVSGRYFLITGGTQGLGLAIARHLHAGGASGLVLVSRMTDERAQEVIEREFGERTPPSSSSSSGPTAAEGAAACRVVFVQADLSVADEALSVVPRALDHLRCATGVGDDTTATSPPVISGLVNAAATSARGNLFTTTADMFDAHMALNARAPFLLTQQLASHLIERKVRGVGSIVNISSVAAHGGAPFVAAYSASKAALSVMTKNNAAELAPHGIRVNAVHMGWCCTDNEHALQTRQSDERWIDRADASVPLGRILRPHDVAVAVGFLLSSASNMMTGSILELHPEYAHGMLSLQDTDAR